MRLFRSILVLMLFTSAVPTAVLGWLLVSRSRDQLVTDSLDLATERVERLRLRTADYLSDASRAVAESASGTRWSELGPVERRRVLEGLLSRREEIAALTVYDRSGAGIPGLEALRAGAQASAVSEHGLRAQPLVATAHPGGPLRWSEVYVARDRREPVITLVVALPDTAIRAVAAQVSLAPLQQIVSRTRVGARGLAFVVDATGHYVAHPDGALVVSEDTVADPALVAQIAGELAAAAEPRDPHVLEFRDARGQEFLGAYAVVPDVRWAVVAAQPRADAFASVHRMRRTAAAGAAISLLLAVALSAWFARGITRPMAACVRGALDIARGRFGRQVEVKARNEIGELAYTFNHMSKELASYDAENRRLIAALEGGYLDTLRALAGAIDAKDAYTRGHNQRVAKLAVEIGRQMGLDEQTLTTLEHGGLLHDIGKIGIPESVLRKKTPLTEEEMALMRDHPAIGAGIVKGVEFLREAVLAIRNHHERWDGSGYPDGLEGERIPLVARIVNAADTYDACTSSRPYQAAMMTEDVLGILASLRGTQIDPSVHDALLAVIERSRTRRAEAVQPASGP
jgi:putative nucleotidyltransferase with HDIG domain